MKLELYVWWKRIHVILGWQGAEVYFTAGPSFGCTFGRLYWGAKVMGSGRYQQHWYRSYGR